MYKDKDKQRETDRERQRRYRRGPGRKGVTRTAETVNPSHPVTPKRGKDIKCFADLPPDVQSTINTISESPEEHRRRTAIAINYQHLFPGRYEPQGAVVTGKPGDADYNGICTPEWRVERGR